MNPARKRRIRIAVILLALTVCCLVWIFSHSLRSAAESSAQSSPFAEFARRLYERLFRGADPDLDFDHAVRKVAHFAEFFLLGVLSSLTVLLFRSPDRPPVLLALPPLVCFAAAAADEWLQTLSPGRSGQWSDVLLDCAGAAAGILMTILIWIPVSRARRKKRQKTNPVQTDSSGD